MIFLLLSITIIIYLWVMTTPFGRFRTLGNKIPGPKSYPLIGGSWWFYYYNSFLEGTIKLHEVFGSVCKLWIGKQLIIIISDPRDIEVILSSHSNIRKPFSYHFLDSWLGSGLITSDGDTWKTHRKRLTPAFHFKLLENSLEVILNHANILTGILSQVNEDEKIDITEYFEKCNLDVICEASMGVKMNFQLSKNNEYLNSLKKVTKSLVDRTVAPWLHPNYIFKHSRVGKTYYNNLEVLHKCVNNIIKERKEILESETEEKNDDSEIRKYVPFIDILLTEKSFTNEEVHQEVQTFMFAGHDTTMTCLSFTIFLLSKHKEVQNNVYEEIRSVVTDINDVTFQNLSKLKYLEKVIKESLRMYTPVPFIARHIDEEIALPSGYVIPVGATVNLFLLNMHNSDEYFTNAKEFNPDRYDSDSNRNIFSYVPFSAGPRNCIGQKFAMMEMKTILIALVLKYEFLPIDYPMTLDMRIILCPIEGINVRLRKRNLS